VPRDRQDDFWPPLYGWGSPLADDRAPRSPVLYRRSTRGVVGRWWAETRAEWRLWWISLAGR
jgi:hypothetical protein